MPDAGESVTVTLTVEPFDATTVASLAVTSPSGAVSSPPATTADDGHTWTAVVAYTVAGLWRLAWTVAGTGAGMRYEVVPVAPPPVVETAIRSYATTTQLANYLHEAPPLNAVKLLERATELLDSDFLKAAVYDVDEDGMPTDPVVAEAFAEAVSAQVEFWAEVGEEVDISGPLQGVTIGSVSLQFGAGDTRSGPDYYAPKLIRALNGIPSEKLRWIAYSGGC